VPICCRDEPEPGSTACVGDVTTLSSGAAGETAGAWLVTVERSVGRSGTGTVGVRWSRVDAVVEEQLERQSPRGTSAGRSVVSPCRVNGIVSVTGICVRRIRSSGRSPEETRRPVPSGCKAAARLCCVFFLVLWWCDFATELLYIYMYFRFN